MHTIGDHAVVLGASMSGLLAAQYRRCLPRVTVVNRDPLPDCAAGPPRPRPGAVMVAGAPGRRPGPAATATTYRHKEVHHAKHESNRARP